MVVKKPVNIFLVFGRSTTTTFEFEVQSANLPEKGAAGERPNCVTKLLQIEELSLGPCGELIIKS